MKTTNILYGSAALAALTLTGACSSDLPNSGPEVSEKDDIRYVRVNIMNPASTRAEDDETSTLNPTFQVGTEKENNVTSLYFKFYDINGDQVGETTTINGLTFTNNIGTPTPSVGKIGSSTVQVSIPKGSYVPSYIVAFLNPVDWSELDNDPDVNSIHDLRDQKRYNYKTNDGDFAMNNAAYYGDDPLTNGKKVKMMGAPVKTDQLYTSEAAANAGNASAVDIYVERYAAKVQFTLGDDANGADNTGVIKDVDQGDYKLRFVPEVWTVNADAPSMYATKRFENSDKNNDVIPTYDDVQTMLGTWTTWNDEPNHRSYWACSPGYYATNFPAVSDNIIDIAAKAPENKGYGKTGAGVAVEPYELRYYSYNQIAGTNSTSDGKGVSVTPGTTTTKYVLENTMGEAAFHSLNPKAAAPSVLLIGHYDLYNADGNKVNFEKGFCIYQDNIFWKDDIPNGASGETILKKLMDSNQILAVQNVTPGEEGKEDVITYEIIKYDQKLANLFEVTHPNAAVRGTQSIPHRYVTLQLKTTDAKDDLQKLYYKPNGADNWQPVVADGTTDAQIANVITAINKQLWAQLSNARAYTNGKCYFSIPIQHLGFTENTANPPFEEAMDADGKPEKDENGNTVYTNTLDWKKVRVGDFGLVRNHVYTIQVSGIQGLASGIEDPDNPLVPSMEDNNYWVKYKVNILNWRIVPAQSGIILK